MNVKANKLLAEIPSVRSIAFTLSAGDESTAIGCAILGSMNKEPETPLQELDNLYLGVEYGDTEIETLIREQNLDTRYIIHKPASVARAVAELLANGKIVSRCGGRMEFGARALGNRSILASPQSLDTVITINEAVKNRDFWMPFAPSIAAEHFDDYVLNPKGIVSPFMMLAFDTTGRGRRELTAAVHRYDKTARAQMVRREANPSYHAIIMEYGKLTGTYAVLNTSFNLHGEPIVCTPADAIGTVDNSGLEYCTMGSYIFEKRERSS